MYEQTTQVDVTLRDSAGMRLLAVQTEGRQHFYMLAPVDAPIWRDEHDLALTIGRAVLIAARVRGEWR